jgi:hypothetical protein
MGRACSTYMEKRTAYRILVVKLEEKGPRGRLDVGGRIRLIWISER